MFVCFVLIDPSKSALPNRDIMRVFIKLRIDNYLDIECEIVCLLYVC